MLLIVAEIRSGADQLHNRAQ